MLFHLYGFWIFFVVVFGVYVTLSQRAQNYFLLFASYVFYLCCCTGRPFWHLEQYFELKSYSFPILMFATSAFDYFIGNKIQALQDEKRRKGWLVFSIIMNLGVLGYFKYCNFFVDNIHAALGAIGWNVAPWHLQITLPVAISFYTFQSMAYTIDIYRRNLQPAKGLVDFLLFVSYFPHLVAGPINRPKGLLSQCERPRRMTWEGWREGATLIVIGLFKKVAVADMIASIPEKTFSNPQNYSSGALLFGLYCFTFQIYADFSGYTDIARGLAKLMGFELMENFNQPYFASNITDFWRRWHISLSTWLRDYLYIPLGGNRHGNFQTYRNLFLTMFLGGLWHGAAWSFAIWGALHGIYLAVHKLMLGDKKPDADAPQSFPIYIVKLLITFHLVAFAWIFFRAGTVQNQSSFTVASQYLSGMLSFSSGKGLISFDADTMTHAAVSIAALLLLVDIPQFLKKDHCVMLRWPLPRRAIGFGILCVWLLMIREIENVPFIYFQF
jgi:alginate O-acetyltransferase complex protein AlgI